MSDIEVSLLIKYIKSVLWRVTKLLSYIEDARYLKFKASKRRRNKEKAREHHVLRGFVHFIFMRFISLIKYRMMNSAGYLAGIEREREREREIGNLHKILVKRP